MLYSCVYITFCCYIKFIFLARAVGMNIGMPERPFKRLETNDLRGITNYFNQYKKLQLIIVVIPDYTDVTYGEYM